MNLLFPSDVEEWGLAARERVKMTGSSCYDPSWLNLLLNAPNMQLLVEFFASGIKEDKMTLGVGAIRMCEAYQAPHPRLDVIASFAGPGLYRELALVDRSTFDAMKSASSLRTSLGLAGWTSEIFESLGEGWLGKMGMLEEVWRADPGLEALPPAVWGLGRIATFRIGQGARIELRISRYFPGEVGRYRALWYLEVAGALVPVSFEAAISTLGMAAAKADGK
jgi:hypothetical protein